MGKVDFLDFDSAGERVLDCSRGFLDFSAEADLCPIAKVLATKSLPYEPQVLINRDFTHD